MNIVIAPQDGMLLVYKPDTRGHVVPDGGGPINYTCLGVLYLIYCPVCGQDERHQ